MDKILEHEESDKSINHAESDKSINHAESEACLDYEELLNEILNIGMVMIQSGAETFRVEESLYHMCQAYDVEHCDFFAIQSNIQATLVSKDKKHYTQIRRIFNSNNNFARLSQLNTLTGYICRHAPEPKEIHVMFEDIMNQKQPSAGLIYVAALMGEFGFSGLVGCNLLDMFVVLLVTGFIMMGFGHWLMKKEQNTFIYNLILCSLSAFLVASLNNWGLPIHEERVILGIIFFLIGGLGISNGIRDMINRDLMSGLLNLMNSVMGALGIACGIFVGLMIWRKGITIDFSASTNDYLGLLLTGIGALGFAVYYNTPVGEAMACAVGAILADLGYILGIHAGWDAFYAMLLAAGITSACAFLMSRIYRSPAIVFLTTIILPLVPGSHLYAGMCAVIQKDYGVAKNEFFLLLSLCLAIQLGFMLVDIIIRFLLYAFGKHRI